MSAADPEARPGWGDRGLALLCALPIAGACARTGLEDSWPLFLVALLPLLVGRRSSARVWAASVLLTFAVPLLPLLTGGMPHLSERALSLGGLAVLAWRGELSRSRDAGRRVQAIRLLLCLWAAWSVGSSLRGLVVNLPHGAPWVGHLLLTQLGGWLFEHPMVDPGQPLARLGLRLELLAICWVGFEMALRGQPVRRELERLLAPILLLGLGISLLEWSLASFWRGEDFFARMSLGMPRNHRPLGDHNALGSALCLLLPVQLVLCLCSLQRRTRAALLQALALVAAVLLLWSSKSKSALAAATLAVGMYPALWLGCGRRLFARVLLVAAGASLALGAFAIASPAHFDSAARAAGPLAPAYSRLISSGPAQYLRDNRVPVWNAGASMWDSHPWFGVGLGNFPRRLVEFRDPEATTVFNPYHENAHSQFLQWAAEEGAVGASMGLLLFAAALGGLLLSARGRPETRAVDLGYAAALLGFFVNQLVGHALLVATVGALFAGWLAVGLAGLCEGAQGGTPIAMRRWCAAFGVTALLSFAPASWSERAPLESYALGCDAWLMDPLSNTPKNRLLGHDARWLQRWEEGDRMRLFVTDMRPGGWFPEPTSVSVELAGELVLEGLELARAASILEPNPQTLLKIDAPPGVERGDLVSVRLVFDPPFAPTMIRDPSRHWVSASLRPPEFRHVGP